MSVRKFDLFFGFPSYGGNGGIASEVPDVREWFQKLAIQLKKDPRVNRIITQTYNDTPITMIRNRMVADARKHNCDFLVMVDSDMAPDIDLKNGDPHAKPFWDTSFDFALAHTETQPVVVGAPYCGPPTVKENVYVFYFEDTNSDHGDENKFSLEQYPRQIAATLSGIQPCGALPTGLIIYDMQVFDLIDPPYFYYEYGDLDETHKASTEDVVNTRNICFNGLAVKGYNPLYCNWDAWAGHHKPYVVGKPTVYGPECVAETLKSAALRTSASERTLDLQGYNAAALRAMASVDVSPQVASEEHTDETNAFDRTHLTPNPGSGDESDSQPASDHEYESPASCRRSCASESDVGWASPRRGAARSDGPIVQAPKSDHETKSTATTSDTTSSFGHPKFKLNWTTLPMSAAEVYGFLHQTPPEHLIALYKFCKLATERIDKTRQNLRYLELGTWIGHSMIEVAEFFDSCVAVDTWQGTPSEANLWSPLKHDNTNFAHALFKENMKRAGIRRASQEPLDNERSIYFDYQIDTRDAARHLEHDSFDVILIDAEHTEEATRRDFETALQLIRPGGHILGHDYGTIQFPGVTRFVQSLAEIPGQGYGVFGKTRFGSYWATTVSGLQKTPTCPAFGVTERHGRNANHQPSGN